MPYFPDLSPYTHLGGRADIVTLNVGWLSRAHRFPRAPAAPDLVRALHRCAFRGERYTMGIHRCEWCTEPDIHAHVEARSTLLGSGEIHVDHEGVCYAAPNLVVHYVQAHAYQPPPAFVAGVLARAERIALLSPAEQEALGGLGTDEQRRLAADAVERMVTASPHTWARESFVAARRGQPDWERTIPRELDDDPLVDALNVLQSLMNDACLAEEEPSARSDFLRIIERSRDR